MRNGTFRYREWKVCNSALQDIQYKIRKYQQLARNPLMIVVVFVNDSASGAVTAATAVVVAAVAAAGGPPETTIGWGHPWPRH